MNPHDATTQLLLQALTEDRVVEACYHDSKGDATTRQIAVFSVGQEYFSGYCFLRDELRTFKSSRLHSLSLTETRIQHTKLIL
jgi:predicted DNA-binding transcriptional regulator YafY